MAQSRAPWRTGPDPGQSLTHKKKKNSMSPWVFYVGQVYFALVRRAFGTVILQCGTVTEQQDLEVSKIRCWESLLQGS